MPNLHNKYLYLMPFLIIFNIFSGRRHSWKICIWQQNPTNFISCFSWRGPVHLFYKTSSVRPRSFYAFCSVQGWKLQNSVGSQPEIHWTSGWSAQIYGRRFVCLILFLVPMVLTIFLTNFFDEFFDEFFFEESFLTNFFWKIFIDL